MHRRTVSGLLLALLIIGLFVPMFNVHPVWAIGTIYIRDDGIDPSTAPISTTDNITYTLTDNINSGAGVGAYGIVIMRDNVVVDGKGFTIQGTESHLSSGIYLSSRENVTIRNMQIKDFFYGVHLCYSSKNIISGNNLTDNQSDGIFLWSNCSHNSISGNNIAANANNGVRLYEYSNYNSIGGNNITNSGHGILFESSCDYNSICGNTISNGIGCGIYLLHSSNNIVNGNNLTANWIGVSLYYSSNSSISGNRMADNSFYGVDLEYSCYYNNVTGNNIIANNWGIYFYTNCSNNTVYHDNIIDNTHQVDISSDSVNIWDNGYPSGGNYWSDYNGSDVKNGVCQNLAGSDGVGDTPYVVDANNMDRYPLMYQRSPPDIVVVKVSPWSTTVYSSYPVFVNTTVENRGNKSESVRVDLFANTTVIGVQDLIIPPHANKTITTMWNTIGFSGRYIMSAYAEPLQEEFNISDNRLTDGYVSVMGRGCFIVVAGNRQDNEFLPTINYGCNQVYKILRQVGYSSDSIYYLNQPECGYQDVDGDGKNDIDNWASSTNLRMAIETWAASRTSPTQPLYLYMFDHGGSDLFCIDNAPDYVYSWQLASWLDNLEGATGAPIHVIYAACHSGSFMDELSKTGRVIIASCKAEEYSASAPGTWEAFSTPFWNQIRSGHSLGLSFNYACSPHSILDYLWRFWTWLANRPQTPLLDDNGDGIGHTGVLPNSGDGYVANSIYIGACEWPYPMINQTMPGLFDYWPPTSSTTLWAKIENNTNLLNVRAYMLPPDWVPPNSTDTLVTLGTEYYEMTDPDHDGNWTVGIPVANFTRHAPETAPNANFTFFITAEQDNGDMATPSVVSVRFSETPDPGIDELPPWVSIERPLANRIVCSTIIINGTVSDDTCMERIEIYVNGNLCGTVTMQPVSSSYFEFPFDTTEFENGNTTILVKAYDSSGNCGNQTLDVVINNFIHDVSLASVSFSKNIMAKETTQKLNITVANHGSYQERFNLTVHANETRIVSQPITLAFGNFTTISLMLNLSSLAYGNYTMSVCAEAVTGETNTWDNNCTYCLVLTIAGDVVYPYFKVDMGDITTLCDAFGSTPGKPNWNLACDIDCNGRIDMGDINYALDSFGKHYP